MFVLSFNFIGLIVLEKNVTNILILGNWTERTMNKGTNKQQHPDSSIHDTASHCACLYQVFISYASQFLKKCDKNIDYNVWKLDRKKNDDIK